MNQLARVETGKFVDTIKSPVYQQKFIDMLPRDVDPARFTEVIIRAVQENPKLLDPSTDKTSLFLSCQRAAQDGLLPDGKEAALVMYGAKVQYQAMIGGLRKRLAGAGFDIRAEVVYENDTFDYDLGDEPSITHKAPALGTPRGDAIGAYAIATELATGRKYREIMDLAALNAVAAVSRAGNGGPWNGPFRGQMQRKTVARRLIATLPIDDRQLQDIIERDNEQYDLDKTKPGPSAVAQAVQATVRAVPIEPEIDDDVIEGESTEVDPFI